MAAGQDGQPVVNVVDSFLQRSGEFFAIFNGENIVKSTLPRLGRMGASPRRQVGAKGPHRQRQSRKTKPLITQFEQLRIGKGGVVLLLVDPVFRQEPLDESLRVALCDHAHGAQRGVEARHFA